MRTLALTIAYDGTEWAGFQRQRDYPSVQGTLEKALSSVFQYPVEVVSAGRTDAGVHAIGQVVSFQTANPIPIDRVAWVTNRSLPTSIVVRRAVEKEAPFHARFSALYRRYWYVVQTIGGPDPFGKRFRWQIGKRLHIEDMQQALAMLEGRHDFAAFCHRREPHATTVRTVHHARVRPWSSGVIIDVQADAFLHQMVRLLVSNAVLIGSGERPLSWLSELMATGVRHRSGIGAPPCGLYLMRIGYPPTVNPRWGAMMEKLHHEELSG